MLLYFDDYIVQSQSLAHALGLPCHIIDRHRFPDGEVKLRLPPALPEQVIFCRSLDDPNEKLVELLLAAKTARELGAKSLTLVAPYLCYMRQDIAFQPGEVVSQRIVGWFIAELFDHVITVDPHLHRIQQLRQAVPAAQAISLSATALMAKFLSARCTDPVLLGPDSEAEQWVAAVANPNQWEYGVCEKVRSGDRQVDITLAKMNLHDKSVILVDDVASSGQTLAVATRHCLSAGAARVDVLVTHALFASDAKQRLLDAGVVNIWSTDSISHESNVIHLQDLFRDAVIKLREA